MLCNGTFFGGISFWFDLLGWTVGEEGREGMEILLDYNFMQKW